MEPGGGVFDQIVENEQACVMRNQMMQVVKNHIQVVFQAGRKIAQQEVDSFGQIERGNISTGQTAFAGRGRTFRQQTRDAGLDGDEEKGRVRVFRTNLVPDRGDAEAIEELLDDRGFALPGLGFQNDGRFPGAAAAQEFGDNALPEEELGGVYLGRVKLIGPDMQAEPLLRNPSWSASLLRPKPRTAEQFRPVNRLKKARKLLGTC